MPLSNKWSPLARSKRILAIVIYLLAALLMQKQYAVAQAPPGDPYPMQAVSFFNFTDQGCPNGWAPFSLGQGRTIVPLMQNGGVGSTVGQPLQSGQDSTHAHTASWTVTLSDATYAGVAGGNNNNVTHSGQKVFSGGPSSAASANIPYIQFLICQKMAPPVQGNIPAGVVAYFTQLQCPSGWTQTLSSPGRFVVGLPPNGAPGATFGGNPLVPQEDRIHVHNLTGTFKPSSGGVGLATGCCASGYGLDSSYPFNGTTDPSSTGFPYIVLLQCQKDPQASSQSQTGKTPMSAWR
ncbi:MAG TPA: hypothetical protein VKZ53_04545 [Candidatus Angelobacter sp.]|nr:hypothetical protein [Candidatus Angelobacter sp.]